METLSFGENYLSIEEEFSNYEDSQIVIFQVPYEHTVSYGGGTGNAPQAIINASAYVEFYDDEFDSELCFDKKIATIASLEATNCARPRLEAQDIQLEQLALVEKTVDSLLSDNKFVVTIGGEHTISTAPIKSYFKKYPDMSVLHFDAHSDLRDSYQDSKYSHACFMARVAEFLPMHNITQVGIRALCKEEREFIRANRINTFFASAIRQGIYGEVWQDAVVKTLQNKVYITFDVDYLDPSIIPSTGTPEPNGFLYHETMEIFRKIKQSGKEIIGLDVVELAPVEGIHHPDLTVARLIYKILNIAFYAGTSPFV